MDNLIPVLKVDFDYNIIEQNELTNKKNLKDFIIFDGSINNYHKQNVLSCDNNDICYKLFCSKKEDYYLVSFIDISTENLIIRRTSHDIKNVANTINSFMYISKKVDNPKMFIPQLKGSLDKIIEIGNELDRFATRKK